MKFFKNENSDSNSFEKTVLFKPKNPVTISFFSDSDVILDSSRDSTEMNNLASAPPVYEINSTFIDAGSNVQMSSNSDNFTSSSENLKNTSVTVQKPRVSPIPVAPAITLVTTP